MPPIPGENPTPTATADWTIMVYIAADDTLANFAVESLRLLHKSATAPGSDDEPKVVVAAEFALPVDGVNPRPNHPQNSSDPNRRRYFFEKGGPSRPMAIKVAAQSAPTQKSDKAPASRPANLSEKTALGNFLTWAYKKCPSDHYALILWGHGPELLLQPTVTNPAGDRTNLYLTPRELRDVLETHKPLNEGHLEIIGFDACSMSMLEMACELKDRADFMVASQEDVPDLSFPYSDLIELFRKSGDDTVPLFLKKGVDAYISTYRDCICNNDTGMKGVTLSVLDLRNGDTLKEAVSEFAAALSEAKENEILPGVLVEARSKSHDFAGGLYVDLYDFCRQLSAHLEGIKGLVRIKNACKGVRDELEERPPKRPGNADGAKASGSVHLKTYGNTEGNGSPASFIFTNSGDPEDDGTSHSALASPLRTEGDGSSDPVPPSLPNSDDDGSANRKKSHGISIYLPYLTVEQYAQVSKPLAKGGPRTGGEKGFGDMLNGAATEYLLCARRNLILDTESYYGRLKFADTHWYDFIARQWTRALVEKVPAELDHHYSAQQSWMNMIRTKDGGAQPDPAKTSVSRETELCAAK